MAARRTLVRPYVFSFSAYTITAVADHVFLRTTPGKRHVNPRAMN